MPFVVAFVMAFGLAATSVAVADHYHVCCGTFGTGHALVHGYSTTDDTWHGRSHAANVVQAHYCAAGASGSTLGDSYVSGQSTCQIQVWGNQFVQGLGENCHSWGYVDWPGITSAHYHSHHNVCGNHAGANPWETTVNTRIKLAAVVAAGMGLGAAAGASLSIGSGAETGDRRAAFAETVPATPETARIGTRDAADPRGGPPWALKEFLAVDGRVCARPGRRQADKVGGLTDKGQVREGNLTIGAICLDRAALDAEVPVDWHISTDHLNPLTGQRDPVTYVWGFVAAGYETVRIKTRTAETAAEVTDRGGFIAVVPGDGVADPSSIQLAAVSPEGKSVNVSVPPVDPALLERIRVMRDPAKVKEAAEAAEKRQHPEAVE